MLYYFTAAYPRRRVHTLLALFVMLLALPAPTLASERFPGQAEIPSITALSTPQATNDATNVYYQCNYAGAYTYFRVYIDTDQSTSSGFQANGIGANYLLENSNLYAYTGTGANWSWSFMQSVGYTNAGGFVQWSVARTAIGESATPNQANLIFQVEAPLESSAKVTHVYSGAAGTTTVTYVPTTALFANPERGFYRYFESRSSAPTVWAVTDFQNTNAVSWLSAAEEATIRQAYCLFYLDTFLDSNISAAFLDHIRANLANVRRAGRKCIVRFAYTWDDRDNNGNGVPDILENANRQTEPDLAQLLAHIDQLTPVLQESSAIITVLQAGFIGIWGEWYYTDHFVDDPTQPDLISAAQYERRQQVVLRLLEALPARRMIALRYPLLKKKMFHRTTPITAAEAFQKTPIARLGFHNDAFLNSYGDSGTFQSAGDRTYLQAESLYLSMGGEVNAPEPGAPSRLCDNAVSQMAKYHWSYINTDYYIPTLQNWKNGGCIHNTSNIAGSILDRLGYRLVLKQGTYPTTGHPDGSLAMQITLANEGFAAPYNARDVYLVLRHTTTAQIFKAKLPDDPRRWLAGQSYTLAHTINLPATLAPGNYALSLHLADPVVALRNKPAYAIRLANANLWRAGSGWNDLLHTVSVTNATAASGAGAMPTAASIELSLSED